MESRLYTVAEAATALGTTSEAVRQRIRRGKLDVVRGNEGLRIRLTETDLSGHRSDNDRSESERWSDKDQTIKALESEAAALREAATRAREGEVRERERADRLDAELAAARQDVAAERARAAEARERAAGLEGEAKGLRLALEAANRPWWRKLIGS